MKFNETEIGQTVYGNNNGRVVEGTVVGDPGMGVGPNGIRWEGVRYQDAESASRNISDAFATRGEAEADVAQAEAERQAARERRIDAQKTKKPRRRTSDDDRCMGVDYTSKYDNND